MQAVVYRRYGSPDELKPEDIPKPAPKEDEVLIKIHASSINSWDWELVQGIPFMNRIGGLFSPQYPVLGSDVAGRVEAVGRNVTRFKPGDEVFGDLCWERWGCFAEYVCAPENALATKPPGLGFEDTAALPQAGALALLGVRYGGGLTRGQTVLINGAGGGAGSFAVQMAKHAGAEVTGVDSGPKLDMIRSLGADHVMDYTQEDYTKTGRRYDRIIDFQARRSFFDYKNALKDGGVFGVVGGASGTIISIALLGPVVSRLGAKQLGLVMHRPDVAVLKELGERAADGRIKPVIEKTYPLREVPQAMRRFATGSVQGKLVITTDASA